MGSLDIMDRSKLGPKYFGPFQVTARVGEVAYKLKLPEGARLHDVFHVGVLKKFHGNPPQHHGQLPPMKNGCACVEPEAAVKSRVAQGHRQLLIKWKGQDEATASWVDAD
jgi:hypothetical protein